MHPVITVKHWSHQLHDGMLFVWHEIDEHLHSRHFWTGVAVAALAIGLVTLIIMLAMHSDLPAETFETYPYGIPYGPYR